MLNAFFYDRDQVLLDQIDKFVSFEVSQKLNDIWNASFEVENTLLNWKTAYIKENNRCNLYIFEDGLEKLLFEWYIRGKECNLTTTKIFLDDKKGILDDKLLYADLSVTGSIDSVLQDILDDVNAREDTLLTLDCGITTSITKVYKKWEIIYSIFDDIAGDMYERVVRNNVLYFKATVGIDRTIAGDNYLEYTWDYLNPYNKTVNKAKMTTDIKEFANCAIGRSSAGVSQAEDATSITEYWRVERPVTNSGDIANTVTNFVNARKEQLREYDIEPMENDFFACDLWDSVYVYIDTGFDEMYFAGAMKVIEKSMDGWDINLVRIKLAKTKVKKSDLFSKIKGMDKKIQKIEMTK